MSGVDVPCVPTNVEVEYFLVFGIVSSVFIKPDNFMIVFLACLFDVSQTNLIIFLVLAYSK